MRGKSAAVLTKQLKDEHRIVTTAIEDYKNQYVDYAGVNAVGIATSVVNTPAELDRFCSAVEAIAR